MQRVADVAKYFLSLSEPDEGDTISNLKLQKLCYYAQGFALVLLGRPLFGEAIQAWDHGPVVPEIYHQYKEYGSGAIPVSENLDLSTFERDEIELMLEIWNVFGQFSAWKLRNMTHEEPPWKDTQPGSVISHDALRNYFRTRVEA